MQNWLLKQSDESAKHCFILKKKLLKFLTTFDCLLYVWVDLKKDIKGMFPTPLSIFLSCSILCSILKIKVTVSRSYQGHTRLHQCFLILYCEHRSADFWNQFQIQCKPSQDLMHYQKLCLFYVNAFALLIFWKW